MPYIIILVLLLAAGGAGYYHVGNLQTKIDNLNKINAAFETRDREQKEAIAQVQKDFELQTAQLNQLSGKFAEAEAEQRRYLDIFKRHNLNKLAAAKPGLIETRANKATKEVFDAIEADSSFVDDLDG